MFKNTTLISLPRQDLLRPPGALPILATACEEAGIEYFVSDFNLWLYRNVDKINWNQINDNWILDNPGERADEAFYKIFLEKLKKYVDLIVANGSDLIAISVFSDDSGCCAYELIKELNRRPERQSFKIVIGGSGIRANVNSGTLCQMLLDNNQIDFYIFGEAEISFRKLLAGDYNHPGINNFDAVQVEDLDGFPFPSYNKIDPRLYENLGEPEVIITGSRGCVRKCTYCNVAAAWPKFRYRSGQCIADEFYYYYKTMGIRNFEFSDSLINGSMREFRTMNLALLEYQQKDPEFKISYKGQFICRNESAMTEEDYKNMKLAGGDYVYVGIESFSQSVRYAVRKKFSNSDIDFHLRMCGKYGIKNSFLMLVGYPTETEKDHRENINGLEKYEKYALSGTIELITFGWTTNILADTPLFHMQHELEIVPVLDVDIKSAPWNWISLNNPKLTVVERIRRWVELVELASKLGYNLPRSTQYIERFIRILSVLKTKK